MKRRTKLAIERQIPEAIAAWHRMCAAWEANTLAKQMIADQLTDAEDDCE